MSQSHPVKSGDRGVGSVCMYWEVNIPRQVTPALDTRVFIKRDFKRKSESGQCNMKLPCTPISKLHISSVLPEPLVQVWVDLALLGDEASLWSLMQVRVADKASYSLITTLFKHHMASIPRNPASHFLTHAALMFRLRLKVQPPYFVWGVRDQNLLALRKGVFDKYLTAEAKRRLPLKRFSFEYCVKFDSTTLYGSVPPLKIAGLVG